MISVFFGFDACSNHDAAAQNATGRSPNFVMGSRPKPKTGTPCSKPAVSSRRASAPTWGGDQMNPGFGDKFIIVGHFGALDTMFGGVLEGGVGTSLPRLPKLGECGVQQTRVA